MRRAVALTAVVALSGVALGQTVASATAQQWMWISYVIAADGRGELIANLIPDGSGTYSFARCPGGGSSCVPVSATRDDPRVLDVGNALPGTVFVATGTHGTTTSSARSSPYLGPVRATRPPAVRGRLRVGALVRPMAGSWAGGWGTERDRLQLLACRSRAGGFCVALSDSIYENGCPGTGAVLDAHYKGWFVRVVDQRTGSGTFYPLIDYLNGSEPVIAPSPDAASTVAGPILAGQGPPASNCGPGYSGALPSLRLLARAVLRDRSLTLGTIFGGCVSRCRVDYVARRHRRVIRITQQLANGGPGQVLLMPLKSSRVLGQGPIEVTLVAAGHQLAAGKIILPRTRNK